MNNENTPENKSADAVLDAFSEADSKTNEEFRKRWDSTIREAKRRKEERLHSEEVLAKQEEERKLREQRAAFLRSKHEAPPGIPLNLSELARVIKQRAENASFEEITASKPKEEPEEKSFVYHDEAAIVAQKAMGEEKNLYIPLPRMRDRRRKKSFSQTLVFRLKTRLSKDGLRSFARKSFPAKGDDKAEIFRKTVRSGSLVILVFALAFLGNYYADFLRRIDKTKGYEEAMSSLSALPPEKLEDEWERIRALYPDITFPEGMNIKFSELYAINQNVVGWLKVDNTKINTVLLQADNNSYHLKHNIYGEYTRFGNPYVHCNCKMGKEGLSKNTIFYGHNANDGLMFHDLINYMSVSGYKKSPIVTLDTLYEQTKWKVFAVVLTNSDPAEDNGRVWTYLYPEFSSETHFTKVVAEIFDRTIIKTGVDVLPTDKIMTLYTCCTYQLESGRLAVFARQIRPGESEEVDLSKVYYNSDAHYPQAWYDKKGTQNPNAPSSEAQPEQNSSQAQAVSPSEAPASSEAASQETTSQPSAQEPSQSEAPSITPSDEAPPQQSSEASSESTPTEAENAGGPSAEASSGAESVG